MKHVSGERECPICDTVVASFDPGGHPDRLRLDAKCQTCGSLERHRGLWLFFRKRIFHRRIPVRHGRMGIRMLHVAPRGMRMLHVAPETHLRDRFQTVRHLSYLTADLDPAKAMVQMDLTNIDLPDDSFDLILASHVLEHIPDDLAAMRELRRVLRPLGKLILAVPMWGDVTREDLSITDPGERRRLYGQDDHVRMYGHDGVFEERLRAAGFEVTIDSVIADMAPALQERYRVLAHELIFQCE